MVPNLTSVNNTMVASIEYYSILPLNYSILYREYNLTRFNHQKNATQEILRTWCLSGPWEAMEIAVAPLLFL